MKSNKISLVIALLVGVYVGLCKIGTPVAQAIGPPNNVIKLTDFGKPEPFNLDINLNKGTVKTNGFVPKVNVTITTATKYYPYVVYKENKMSVVKWVEVDKSIIDSLKTTPSIFAGLR